jgi:glycosyltransferase involved in cell wall biosynthesis
MNIALICDYSLDYLGGAQTAFLAEARALADAGHSVVVVTPSAWRGDGGVLHEPIYPRVVIPGLGLPLVRNTGRLRARLDELFREHAIDVVHVHSEFGLVAAAVDVASPRGLPVVHTVHTFFWRTHLPGPLQRIAAAGIRSFQRFVTGHPAALLPVDRPAADAAMCAITLATSRRASVVVSPSAHQRAHLLRAGLSDVETIPNTVITVDRRRGDPLVPFTGPLRVVWIGRCVREKRLLEFVAACRDAVRLLPTGALEVEVVGDGPLLAAARLLAADTPGVDFTGRVDSAGVAEALGRSHIVALTSSGFDNQPMTVVEALYAARGVLYVDPALTEGVDVAGILARSDAVHDITRAIVRLANNPQQLVDLSARAASAFDVFAPDLHATQLTALYRDQLVSAAS